MSKKIFREQWKEYSKLDKMGIITYFILLMGFLVGLTYWGYFSEEIIILKNTLNPDKEFGKGFFYFVLILLGLFKLS